MWEFGVFACFRLNFEVSPLKFYGKPGKPNGCLQVGSAQVAGLVVESFYPRPIQVRKWRGGGWKGSETH